jgi:MoxR-like ATPase
MSPVNNIVRPQAEDLYTEELAALKDWDQKNKHSLPPSWQLSPKAVYTFIVGGDVDGLRIERKFFDHDRKIQVAIATLTTDRALLLYGVPGTGKSMLSELLAAGVSGDSTLMVQGTSGTSDEKIQYGWNYAQLLAHGPSWDAVVKTSVLRAMEEGRLVRVEELTRIPSDVQDCLITILSEKMLPVPELNEHVSATKGFNIIATANNKDKGVNDLSSALKRRFNTVILDLPSTLESEIEIVTKRVQDLGQSLSLPTDINALDEIRRVVQIFRELRSGRSAEGEKVKPPSATLSAAEAISVINSGLSLATHFGDGKIQPADIASGIEGAVIKEPEDRQVFQDYINRILKVRRGWDDMFTALRDVI